MIKHLLILAAELLLQAKQVEFVFDESWVNFNEIVMTIQLDQPLNPWDLLYRSAKSAQITLTFIITDSFLQS